MGCGNWGLSLIFQSNSRQGGFTLTELLVAMAIFITLMGSMIALFSGTVDTTRAGYARLSTFEMGRTIVEVMKRDLNSAFTARDFGDNFQFYGQENGFCFVGTNENGEISRISYAVNRLDGRNDFPSDFNEELGILVRRAMTQGTNASPRGDTNPLDARVLDGLILAQNLVSALNSLGALPSSVDALAVWNALENEKFSVTSSTWPNQPVNPPPFWPFTTDLSGPFLNVFDDAIVEVEAVYQMGHLLRFEEPGQSRLEGFLLPGDSFAPGSMVTGWPKMSLDAPLADIYKTAGEGVDNNEELYFAELRSINPAFSADMRNFLPAFEYIDTNVIESLLRANRRKIWVDFITQTPQTKFSGQFAWSFWQVPEGPEQKPVLPGSVNIVNIVDYRENPLDYVVAEQFVMRAVVRGSDVDNDFNGPDAIYPSIGGGVVSLADASGNLVDLLGSPSFFSYAQGRGNSDGHFLDTFNANKNIIGSLDAGGLYGYEAMVRNTLADPANAPSYFGLLDEALLNANTGYKSSTTLQGSPLFPRIPSLIKVQFWVAKRGISAGNPPIKHWFTEVVDVPAGMTRRAPTTIASISGQ